MKRTIYLEADILADKVFHPGDMACYVSSNNELITDCKVIDVWNDKGAIRVALGKGMLIAHIERNRVAKQV